MGETHNVISRKRISRALKLVPILSNKARLLDLVGHCNQVLCHATYLGYKCYLAKNKRTGKDVCMHICSNKFYFKSNLKFIFYCYRSYINIYINFHIDSKSLQIISCAKNVNIISKSFM